MNLTAAAPILAVLLLGAPEGAAAPSFWGRVRLFCESLGVCDPEPLLSTTFELLCDRSEGSTCTVEAFRAATAAVQQQALKRPHSRIRVWELGRSLTDTRAVAAIDNAGPSESGRRAERAYAAEFDSTYRAAIEGAEQSIFANRIKGRSPIAEGIGAIALASFHTERRVLIVLTDLREVSSFADFECAAIDAKAFADRLFAGKVFKHDSLAGAEVVFANTAPQPVAGRACPVDLARSLAGREAWTEVLRRAGAATVSFQTGALELETR